MQPYPRAPFRLAALLLLNFAAPAAPHLVTVVPGGKLAYTPNERGNVIPDFSNCGYGGGGVALPTSAEVPVRVTVHPGDGDDGPRIQAAIDEVSKLPADAHGVRGAVLLAKGTYHVAGSVSIARGGVVLRGEGRSEGGTVLVATGTSRRTVINVGSAGRAEAEPADEEGDPRKPAKPSEAVKSPAKVRKVTDAYVPVGRTPSRSTTPTA